MIWFLLIPVIVCGFVVYNWGEFDWPGVFITLVFGSVIGCCIAVMVNVGVGAFLPITQDLTPRYQATLVSLKTSGGLEGHFFLGTGSIEGKQYYQWYQLANDGFVTPRNLEVSNNVFVREEERVGGEVTSFGFKLDGPAWLRWLDCVTPGDEQRIWVFKIPLGSFKKEISLP